MILHINQWLCPRPCAEGRLQRIFRQRRPDVPRPAARRVAAAKDFVFRIRAPGGAKAWPIEAFAGGAVINDRVGFTDVVLVGDAATRTCAPSLAGDAAFPPPKAPTMISIRW